jgi:hypothetical protein
VHVDQTDQALGLGLDGGGLVLVSIGVLHLGATINGSSVIARIETELETKQKKHTCCSA